MIVLAACLTLALVLVVVASLLTLDKVLSRQAIVAASERNDFLAERESWLHERQILLNRIMDPPAGVAQSLAIGRPPAAFDPSEADEWPEMPDFPGQNSERTLT